MPEVCRAGSWEGKKDMKDGKKAQTKDCKAVLMLKSAKKKITRMGRGHACHSLT
jgi:hypothetical protein